MAYRRLRLEANLTQLEVEASARLTKGRFWKIENGFENATDDERAGLAKAFKCELDQLPTMDDQSDAVAS